MRIELTRKRFPGRPGEPDRTILEDVTLELGSGEFVCLTGPSGCGKTTVLNLISGIDRDFEGHLEEPEDYRLAYVFQQPCLLPWRTVEENLRLVLPKAERQHSERPLHYLKRMGLADYRNAYPGDLSLGMARRASLARAFSIDPDLLLLDEPFVSLDEDNARLLKHLLLELWSERRCSVLCVTHDLEEALELADRILFMCPQERGIPYEYRPPLSREERTPEQISRLRQELPRPSQPKEKP